MSVSELIRKLWNIYPVEHYSAIKRRKPTTDIWKNIDEPQMHLCKVKEARLKRQHDTIPFI